MSEDGRSSAGGSAGAYFTSSALAGKQRGADGFHVTPSGAGAKNFNVGSLGTTIGLQNKTSYSVMQILQAGEFQESL